MKSVSEQVTNNGNSNITTATRSKFADFNVRGLDPTIRGSCLTLQFDAYAYLILDERGKVLKAKELENPSKKKKAQTFLQAAAKAHDFPYGYIVYRGTLITADKTRKPIQLIFMRCLPASLKDTLHPRIHDLAMQIFHIRDICQSLNITLDHSEAVNDYYHSGEVKFSDMVKALEDLEGKLLNSAVFNTKGTKTEHFKGKDSEPLISFIPRNCMVFTMKPIDDKSKINYDDHLMLKIIMPSGVEEVSEQKQSTKLAKEPVPNCTPGESVRVGWLKSVGSLISVGFFTYNDENMNFNSKVEVERVDSLDNVSQDKREFQQN